MTLQRMKRHAHDAFLVSLLLVLLLFDGCCSAFVIQRQPATTTLVQSVTSSWRPLELCGRPHGGCRPTTSVRLYASPEDLLDSTSLSSVLPLLLVVVALVLGVGANSWIGKLLNGDDNKATGLAAFLKDGQGYNRSGFSLTNKSNEDRAVSSDPLPWLKLPKLDFVEVAGQQTEQQVLEERLESLRLDMNEELDKGNVQEADRLRKELESLLRESGMEFQTKPGERR
jgi:hypothetical protein